MRIQSYYYVFGIFFFTSFYCLASSSLVNLECHSFGRQYLCQQENYKLPIDTHNTEFQVKVKCKIISRDSPSDARGYSNNQIAVSIFINGDLVAIFEDFGDMDFDASTNQIFIESSISSKVYSIEALDSDTVIISKTLWFEGVENHLWTRTYQSHWDLIGCYGECQ